MALKAKKTARRTSHLGLVGGDSAMPSPQDADGLTAPVPRRQRGLRSVSFAWLLPNLLTIAALASGLSGLRMAFSGNWEGGLLMVALAGIFDALDGRMARLLKSSSNFGAQLDSLADVVVFGVVPALMLYLWALQESGRIAWAACLFFSACIALRLARFNSELHGQPSWSKNYFTGIPSPAAAFIVLLPLAASLATDLELFADWRLVAAWLVIIGTGAISTIPSFAAKSIKVPSVFALPLLGVFALLVAAVVARPWLAWLGLGLVYLALLPVSWLFYLRLARRHR